MERLNIISTAELIYNDEIHKIETYQAILEEIASNEYTHKKDAKRVARSYIVQLALQTSKIDFQPIDDFITETLETVAW